MSWKTWIVVACAIVGLSVGYGVHQNSLFDQARIHARSLIDPLGHYRTANGRYPEDLRELTYFAQLDNYYHQQIVYTYYEGGTEFFLSAVHPWTREADTYTSEQGRWHRHHLQELTTVLKQATAQR